MMSLVSIVTMLYTHQMKIVKGEIKMIEWLSTTINPPEADREIIGKNPDKLCLSGSAAKQCKVMKFHPSFSEKQIIEVMLSDDLTLWSYTE